MAKLDSDINAALGSTPIRDDATSLDQATAIVNKKEPIKELHRWTMPASTFTGIATPKTREEYDALPAGAKLFSPSGKIIEKPVDVGEDISKVSSLPGKTNYVVHGQAGTTPDYQSIGFLSSVEHAFAYGDPTKEEEALRKHYGDKVKRDPVYGLIVDDNGVIRKPTYGTEISRIGEYARDVAPLVGMTLATMAIPEVTIPAKLMSVAWRTAAGAGLGEAANEGISKALGLFNKSTQDAITGPISEGLWAAGGAFAGAGAVVGTAAIGAEAALRISGQKLAIDAYNKGKEAIVKNPTSGWMTSVAKFFKEGVSDENAALIAHVVGADKEGLDRAYRLRTEGGIAIQHPDNIMKEFPTMSYAANLYEAFYRSRPYLTEAAKYVEGVAQGIANRFDTSIGPAIGSIQDPGYKTLGEYVMNTVNKLPKLDDKLASLIRKKETTAEEVIKTATAPDSSIRLAHLDRNAQLREVSEERRDAIIDYTQSSVRGMLKAQENLLADLAKPDAKGETKQAIQQINDLFAAVWTNLSTQANRGYSAAYAEAEKTPIDLSALKTYKDDLLNIFPVGTQEHIIFNKDVNALFDAPATLQQVHNIYKLASDGVRWDRVAPSFRERLEKGVLHELKSTITDPPKTAPQNLINAAKIMRDNDQAYAASRKQFNDGIFDAMRNQFSAGFLPEMENLAGVAFSQPFSNERVQWIKGILGPQMTEMLVDADIRRIVKSNGVSTGSIEVTGEVTLDLAKAEAELAKRVGAGYYGEGRSGLLSTKQKSLLDQLHTLNQANVGTMNVKIEKDDTLAMLVNKFRGAKMEAEAHAATNPIAAFSEGINKTINSLHRIQASFKKQMAADPLGFMDHTADINVNAAGKKIVHNPDILSAYIEKHGYTKLKTVDEEGNIRFVRGEATDGLKILRSIMLRNILGFSKDDFGGMAHIGERIEKMGLAPRVNVLNKGSVDPITKEIIEPISDETAGLLFPGTTVSDLVQLAQDAVSLFKHHGDVGQAIMATSVVTHATQKIPGGAGLIHKIYPIAAIPVQFASRMFLGRFFKFAVEAANTPEFMDMLKRGIAHKDLASKEAVYKQLIDAINAQGKVGKMLAGTTRAPEMGAAIGTAIGENVQEQGSYNVD